MDSLFEYLTLSAIACEILLRLLPTKTDITVLRMLRDLINRLHNLIPNNIVPKHDSYR